MLEKSKILSVITNLESDLTCRTLLKQHDYIGNDGPNWFYEKKYTNKDVMTKIHVKKRCVLGTLRPF